ncbi:MAG: glycosyltransferase, partial [Micromonosporaceae bacterium]|nr:glycosyltransferase [Micromonosporaceae bacterium]
MTITYGLLSTHPPTHCGLATFNAALSTHLAAAGGCCGVVRMTAHAEDTRPRPEVVHTWLAGQQAGWLDAASVLNGFDVAVVQHEYGIYPGRDGYDVLPLLRHLTIPSIVILHTVLASPTTRQKTLLEQIAATADTVVTMTETARQRLLAGYRVNPGTVTVIPHGAALHADAPTGPRPRPHLLTWGLLGPGKGIEWTLRALALLQDLDPTPTYTVAGRTHPKVLDHDGEAYRDSLHHLSAQLGLAHSVAFDPVYRDEVAL